MAWLARYFVTVRKRRALFQLLLVVSVFFVVGAENANAKQEEAKGGNDLSPVQKDASSPEEKKSSKENMFSDEKSKLIDDEKRDAAGEFKKSKNSPEKKLVIPVRILKSVPSSVVRKRNDPLDATPGVLAKLKVYVDRPVEGEELQLERYLLPLLGQPATGALAEDAEARLIGIGRYRAAICRYTKLENRQLVKELACGVTRFVTIRSLEIEGVPWTFLEENIRRRIFLRPGEILEKRDESGESRIHRQRIRVERFLAQKGLRGARVRIQSPPVTVSSDVKVKLRIIGGEFSRVHDVKVHQAAPFQARSLRDSFAFMCNGDGLLEGFETQSLRCFSDDRLREVIEKMEVELVELGFPEGRVRVTTRWIDPRKTKEEACRIPKDRQKIYKGKPPDICVDLDVIVESGPRLVPRISISNQGEVLGTQRPPFFFSKSVLGLGRGFLGAARRITDFFSRTVQYFGHRPLKEAGDTVVAKQDLLDVLTFSQARSAQESEVSMSIVALQKELAKRGYLRAQIQTRFQRYGAERVEVDFDVELGPPVAVQEVTFVGNKAFSDEDLKDIGLAAQPRKPGYTGFVSNEDLELDRRRLVHFYEREGFSEVEVKARAMQEGERIVVRFEIQEESRWLVERIELEGVPNELVTQVLSAMEHCQRGELGKNKMPLVSPQSCHGAPFLPGETDPLDVDGRRALNVLVANGFPFAKAELELSDFLDDGRVVLKLIADIEGTRRNSEEKDDASDDDKVAEKEEENKVGRGRVLRGTLFVDGNTRTREDVIRREFGVVSKELRPREIADGVSRLRKTGLFSRVSLSYIGIDEQRDRVDLRVRVEEKPVITGDVSASFSTAQYFGLHGELRDRNFLGSMWDLSAKGDLGLFIGRYSQLELPFRWPRLLGLPVDLKVSPSVVYQDLPASVAKLPPSSERVIALGLWSDGARRRRQLQVDLNAALDFKLLPRSNKLVLSISYDARIDWDDPLGERLELFSEKSITSVDGIGTLLFESDVTPVPFLGATTSIAYRDVDNLFDPKDGVIFEGSVTGGHPMPIQDSAGNFGVGEWVLLPSLRTAGYATFSRFTFAGSFRGWWGVSRSDDLDFSSVLVRNQSLLASGGDRSVRGFGQDEIGVKDLAAIASSGTAIYDEETHLLSVVGFVANMEVRFLVLRNFAIGDLSFAAFIDASLITDTPGDLLEGPFTLLDEEGESRRYAHPRFGVGMGVGIRYVLPVGPMSMDFAVSPTSLIHEALVGNLGPEDLLPRPHIQLGFAF
ncbi:MAG: BamA/TamA family outer membrane protein [Deltaproteobacteria bacterium]|nr:BamA/TamA family outer membrane protein [Deltaproteobacteria bacterium]